ncbi:Cation channel sperm-associated protein subunit delta/epsilon like protein, partial [Aduncisulcus paluster]
TTKKIYQCEEGTHQFTIGCDAVVDTFDISVSLNSDEFKWFSSAYYIDSDGNIGEKLPVPMTLYDYAENKDDIGDDSVTRSVLLRIWAEPSYSNLPDTETGSVFRGGFPVTPSSDGELYSRALHFTGEKPHIILSSIRTFDATTDIEWNSDSNTWDIELLVQEGLGHFIITSRRSMNFSYNTISACSFLMGDPSWTATTSSNSESWCAVTDTSSFDTTVQTDFTFLCSPFMDRHCIGLPVPTSSLRGIVSQSSFQYFVTTSMRFEVLPAPSTITASSPAAQHLSFIPRGAIGIATTPSDPLDLSTVMPLARGVLIQSVDSDGSGVYFSIDNQTLILLPLTDDTSKDWVPITGLTPRHVLDRDGRWTTTNSMIAAVGCNVSESGDCSVSWLNVGDSEVLHTLDHNLTQDNIDEEGALVPLANDATLDLSSESLSVLGSAHIKHISTCVISTTNVSIILCTFHGSDNATYFGEIELTAQNKDGTAAAASLEQCTKISSSEVDYTISTFLEGGQDLILHPMEIDGGPLYLSTVQGVGKTELNILYRDGTQFDTSIEYIESIQANRHGLVVMKSNEGKLFAGDFINGIFYEIHSPISDSSSIHLRFGSGGERLEFLQWNTDSASVSGEKQQYVIPFTYLTFTSELMLQQYPSNNRSTLPLTCPMSRMDVSEVPFSIHLDYCDDEESFSISTISKSATPIWVSVIYPSTLDAPSASHSLQLVSDNSKAIAISTSHYEISNSKNENMCGAYRFVTNIFSPGCTVWLNMQRSISLSSILSTAAIYSATDYDTKVVTTTELETVHEGFFSLPSFSTVSPVVSIRAGCPPGRHIRVSGVTFDSSQCPDFASGGSKHSLVSSSGKIDSLLTKSFLDSQLVDPDITEYDVAEFGCPISVYHGVESYLPTIELWDGSDKIRDVSAEFIIWEVQGRTDWETLITCQEAGCSYPAQSMKTVWDAFDHPTITDPTGRDMWDFWDREVYESCNTEDLKGAMASLDQSYPFLSADGGNGIAFNNIGNDGTFLFSVKVIDPEYTVCELETYLGMDVYGAPLSGTVNVIVILSITAICIGGLFVSFLLSRKRNSSLDG